MLKFKKSEELPEVSITVTTETFIRLALLTVGTVFLIVAIHKAAHALLLIFIAFFLAIALNGPVYRLSKTLPGKRKGSRTAATTLSFVIVVVLLGLFVASIAPPLIRQTENLTSAAPRLIRDFRGQNSEVGQVIRKYHLEEQVNKFSGQLSERLQGVGGSAFSTVQRIGTSFFSLLTILVLTFMMLVEGPRWMAFGRDLVPDRHHRLADRISHDMYKVITGYVNGQVLLAALAAVLILPAILALHISYPAALVVIVFVCGLIPMVGHTIGAIIVTTVALFHSASSAIIILAYYILYQQIENYLIQPRIQANTTNMSPLLVFASLIVGVSFGGLVGGLVAIPVAGCIRIAVLEYLYSQDIIDEPEFKRITKEAK